ncbi:Protein farnesyltransferase/geranylgeranyltransferase type-1 subunit alpha [Halotydeus destructor]|nr:Protein farnesyltransferase/geranylgeranyltransferase type-1 subunit alpha [Halotydeus destructor]
MALSVDEKSRIREHLAASMSRRQPSTDSDSSNSSEDEFVPYGQRPEWKDVEPVFQDDGPNPVCAIDYTAKFKNTFDYFRAVLAKDEHSERALSLTKDAAELNPANYTVWYFRRVVLKELNKNLFEELEYIDSVIMDHPKNYQVWHHRKAIVEWLNDGSIEKVFTATILEQDAKNYHAWQHRQWAINHFQLFNDELEYTESLIAQDIRNNSAWNHRFFVISRTTTFESKPVYERELSFTQEKISKTPNNESPWNYLRGVLEASKQPLNSELPFCEELYEKKKIRSPFLIGFMVDAIEEQLESRKVGGDVDYTVQYERSIDLTNVLANEADKIRKEYWTYIQNTLKQNYGPK